MSSPLITKSTLQFLKELEQNNQRDWFSENKDKYVKAQQNIGDFADALIKAMNKHDRIENESGKKSLFRIYNDVRFSKEKSPYNARFAFSLQRATKARRGGYYVHIKPAKCYLACGFFGPNSEDLKRIREDISDNYSTWKRLLNQKGIQKNFGEMRGQKVITAPRGYAKDHPAIELLKYKQFIFRHEFKDAEVHSADFLNKVNELFISIRPIFNYMSEVLTTDKNGLSLL